jgi:glucose/arabinose dehydrogenase
LAFEPLEDRRLLTGGAPFSVAGPGVNPADFRITTFASGLNYPAGMVTLSDGSLLVGVSNLSGGAAYADSGGALLRFADANGDGVADNPAGQVLYNGLPGELSGLSRAGEFLLATSAHSGSERISVLRAGSGPADPLTLVGSINFGFPSGWWHTTFANAVWPVPGQSGTYELFFNVGSANNGVARDGNGNVILDGGGNPTYQLTTQSVSASGLLNATLQGDSIYMVTLQDSGGTPVLSGLARIASGVRNAASMAVDSAGNLFFADNGIDGNGGGEYGWSTDELDEITAAQIRAGNDLFFGFPETVGGQLQVSYVRTNGQPGQSETVINPGVGVQPLVAFEPLADPSLGSLGSRAQGASGFALSPSGFPAGLNDGVFVGFHGEWDLGGTANGKNPLVFANPATGQYFDFVSNDEAGVGHFDGAASTSDSLFLSDLSPGGSTESGAGTGAIYQIKAISPSPTPTPTPPPNQPPALQAIANQTVNEGQPLSVQAVATDPDGDAITFGLGPGAPPGSSINANTGLFSWTPDPYSSTGTYSVTVTATDNGSPPLSDSTSFTIDVLAVNHPPHLNALPTPIVERGTTVQVMVSRYASDPDVPAQALTYALTSGVPSGSTFDPATGLFAWTVPTDQALGSDAIGVTVTDNGSPPMSTSGTFTINVVPYTPPPVLAPIAAQTVDEGTPMAVQVSATDSPGIAIGYALGPGAPAGAAIDPTTGVFTWAPDPYASTGQYTVSVVATANGPVPKTASPSFAIDVLAVNHPPYFTAALPAQLVASGQVLQFAVSAYAADRDRPTQALTYSLAAGAPAGASIDPASGVFTWVTSPGQHVGAYSFGVTVTDGGSPPMSAAAGFTVDVFDSGPVAKVAQAKVSRKHGLTISLKFSQPLDPSAAANLADYVLVPLKKSKKGAPATNIALTASYDPSSNTVTLAAQAPLKRGQALRLTVIGGGPGGLLKATGGPFAGDGVHAGTSYVAAITGASIRQTNAARGAGRRR